MSKLRQMVLMNFAIVIGLTASACAVTSPAATATPVNTQTPRVSPTPENTPFPKITATPQPYIPTLEGAIDMPGKYGGYKLRYQCFGKGTPTVIVEAGGGDQPVSSLSWKKVIQQAQGITRICIYDRVDRVNSQNIAEDLHTMLGKIPLPGPYIFVAHSLGGWHARLFAHLYPKEVVGMILVDSSTVNPETNIALATAYPTFVADEDPAITKYRVSAADVMATEEPFNGLLDMGVSSEQVRQAGSLGDIPLIVIAHNPSMDGFPDYFPDIVRQDYAQAEIKLQADLATLSSQGVLIVAKTTNHYIPLTEPQIIIDAIARMVEAVRKQ